MAVSSYAMQSILSNPLMGMSTRSRVNHFGIPAMYLRRNVSLRVRSMAEVLDLTIVSDIIFCFFHVVMLFELFLIINYGTIICY